MTVHITEEQSKLLFGDKPRRKFPRAKTNARVKRRKEDLPENIVTKQICDFLRLRGWRLFRQQVGRYVPYSVALRLHEMHQSPAGALVRIGEPGMPDWRAERPIERKPGAPVNVFHLEMKAPGKSPDPDQVAWMRDANATGTLAVWFDGFDSFIGWYSTRFPGEVANAR